MIYKCPMCREFFSERADLFMHQKIHTAEKPHKCDKCDKGFFHVSELHIHWRDHTGEKVYKCDDCGVNVCANHPFLRSFNEYLLHTSGVPGTVPDAGDTLSETAKGLCPWSLLLVEETGDTQSFCSGSLGDIADL